MRIGETVQIHVETFIHSKPRLFLSDRKVLLSEALSVQDFYALLNEGLGSIPDYLPIGEEVETFCFQHESGFLHGTFISYSEVHRELSNIDKLLNCKKIEGTLQLLNIDSNFSVKPFNYHFFSSHHNFLMGFDDEGFLDGEILELKIGLDLSLLFSKGCYAAWILYSPECYLAESFEDAPCVSSEQSREWFGIIFKLFNESLYRDMGKKSDAAAKKILKVYQQLRQMDNKDRTLIKLQAWVFDQFDRYYFGTKWESRFNEIE
jgi:hypothetical protein